MPKENPNKWTKQQLLDLYKFKQEEKKDLREISKLLGKSIGSIELKFKRVDWDSFIEDPDGYLSGNAVAKKWTQVEMAQLYAFIQSGKSYSFIAEELKRSYISVERKAQTTDWKAWKTVVGDPQKPEEDISQENENVRQQLASALVLLSRQQKERLEGIDEEEFKRKINFDGTTLPISFSEIKKTAGEHLDALGFGNPEVMELGKGTYVVVGDSHGKFTKTHMFHLLKEVESHIKPDKIIHIGHLLDDDNDISYHWGMFKNLVVVAKIEELKLVQEQRNKYNFKYDIVRGGVQVGESLMVMNQDLISDYVKNPLSSLDSMIFDSRVVVNCHRMEWMAKCSEEQQAYIAAPGALCEKHIVSTIKQIDFEDGKTSKQAFYGGFSKYRKMQHMCKYWDQGLFVIHVDDDGNHTIVPCLIKKMGENYVTSYFDKIITSDGIKSPNKKIFITADAHSPNHDNDILDIQEQICKDYKPDALVNLGDAHDYKALNHHDLDKGITINKPILGESAHVYHTLKKQATWAKEKYFIYGNHERFAADFVAKFPQFEQYLDIKFLCNIEELGYKMTELKDVLKIGSMKFIHGDLKMFGQPGNMVEKASRTFKESVFVGHQHHPTIRFRSFGVGMSGQLDQEYNEPTASTWIHGFGMCNQYAGQSFPTTVAIIKNCCILNRKAYAPKNSKAWDKPKYAIKLNYELKN